MPYECPNASAATVINLIERAILVDLQDDQMLRPTAKDHPIVLSCLYLDFLWAEGRVALLGGWQREYELIAVSRKSLTNVSNQVAVW